MKKFLFVVALIAAVATTSNAQGWKYGGGLTLGTNMNVDGGVGFGINARADYAFNEKWSIAPGFTFVFPSEVLGTKLNTWQLNADAHYNFMESDGFQLYGLGGLNYTQFKWKYDSSINIPGVGSFGANGEASDSKLGLNIGAGANYGKFFGELKYDTAYEQLGITVGMLFGGK